MVLMCFLLNLSGLMDDNGDWWEDFLNYMYLLGGVVYFFEIYFGYGYLFVLIGEWVMLFLGVIWIDCWCWWSLEWSL